MNDPAKLVPSVPGPASLDFLTGDATAPQGGGARIIAHICNDQGGWGKGFVVALSRRWPEPETSYRQWARSINNRLPLGEIQVVPVAGELWVANMIAQHGIGRDSTGRPPIRYDALASCLRTLGLRALAMGASVHMPRIGCGLAGGRWTEVEPLIAAHVCAVGVPVIVYDPPSPNAERKGSR